MKKSRTKDRNGQGFSPSQDKINNPLKKTRTEDTRTTEPQDMEMSQMNPIAGCSMDQVQSQIVIESENSSLPELNSYSRVEFIKNQRKNRYSSLNLPPYIVHIKSKNNDENLENIHPMKVGKILAKNFSFISNVRKIGKGIIAVNFKYRHEANSFIDNEGILPENWIGYIPNYKIYRTGVDVTLNEEGIRQGIKFHEEILEIRSITRLKFRDRSTMELKDLQSVKIEFASNLLPESLSI